MANNPKVTAAVGGHPIHPMLIPFPVAFLVGTLASDLAFWGTRNPFWAQASLWLVGAGIVMALVAALAGFTDFFGEQRIRDLNAAWYHMLGNLTAVVLAIGNFSCATRKEPTPPFCPGAWFCRSWLSACCCLPAGWAGRWSTATGSGSSIAARARKSSLNGRAAPRKHRA